MKHRINRSLYLAVGWLLERTEFGRAILMRQYLAGYRVGQFVGTTTTAESTIREGGKP